MMEIDYALLDRTDPPPEPARPILASHLLDLEERQRRQFNKGGGSERLKSGCEDIDELLGGGFERGILVGISAGGIEGRLVSIISDVTNRHVLTKSEPQRRELEWSIP
jgi:hypothetical protein